MYFDVPDFAIKQANPENLHHLVAETSNLLNGNDSNPVVTKCQSKVSKKCRNLLWWLSILGFIMNFMARCNLNIGIVSMVAPRNTTHSKQTKVQECFNHSSVFLHVKDSGQSVKDDVIAKGFSIERSILNLFEIPINEKGFDWNEYEQGLVLGAFYWFYPTTQLLGGYLAKRYGTKLVFGVSNFLPCALSSLIPIAAYLNFNFLIFLKALQGIINGLTWPAMHNIISLWIPPNERSRFISGYMGGNFGLAIFYPVFGFIISVSSWEWIFHLTTLYGIIWFVLWQYCVFDSPAEHPRIDLSELNYITEEIGDSVEKDNKEIPWKSIFTSFPFWITVIGNWGNVWQSFFVMIQLPTYFKFIHGFGYEVLGIFSGLPYFLCLAFAYIFSMLIDYLLRTKKLTRTNARKFTIFVSCILVGIVTICLAFVGCNGTMAIVMSSLSICLLGAQTSGPLTSWVDLAPNFSSILMGLSTTFTVIPGMISPYIVGVLTNNNQNIQQWKLVFLISGSVSITCGTIYILFGSSEEQSWNKSSKTVEMKPLNETKFDQSSCENNNQFDS